MVRIAISSTLMSIFCLNVKLQHTRSVLSISVSLVHLYISSVESLYKTLTTLCNQAIPFYYKPYLFYYTYHFNQAVQCWSRMLMYDGWLISTFGNIWHPYVPALVNAVFMLSRLEQDLSLLTKGTVLPLFPPS